MYDSEILIQRRSAIYELRGNKCTATLLLCYAATLHYDMICYGYNGIRLYDTMLYDVTGHDIS